MTEINASTSALDGWGLAASDPKVTLPSGVVVTIRPLDIPTMIQLDILDKMDAFTPKVLDKGGKSKKAAKPEDEKMTADKLTNMISILDKICVACVITPALSPDPQPGEEHDPSVRYVGKIPLGDKMAIFQKAFSGMEDLFRLGAEQGSPVGAVAPVESPALPSE